jgi:5-methyltetrahydropteroyltriglutamate--homocysteine methyltransferase
LLGFPYPEEAGLAPLWAAGVAREGKDEKTAPTVVVGCILTAGREGKMEILDKLYTEGRCGGRATEFRTRMVAAFRGGKIAMKRSEGRFLTTHTGSLPRPDDLIRMMFAKEEGVPVDQAALSARIRSAVAEIVRQQAEAGLDVINDGEVSKPSYATYIKDRLHGFGGTSHPLQYRDLVDFPELARRVFSDPGRSRRRAPACDGLISVRDARAAHTDVEHLQAALGAVKTEEAFLSAASPGVISLFFHNDYYPNHEAYLFAIADAMRHEYEIVAQAGLVLQVDCPDLAMGRHIQFAGASLEEFRNMARLHVETLNHALANIPPDQLRMHLCWGNYEGPHHYDVPLADILDIVLMARPNGISFEAANPRHAHEWELFERVKLPQDKVLIPGVIESKTNYVEHPEVVAQRISRYARLVGREHVIAGTDCGFGTWVGQAAVHPGVVWAKMASLAEGSRLASRAFW